MPRANPVGIGITGGRLRRAVIAGARKAKWDDMWAPHANGVAEQTSADLVVTVDSGTLSGGLALVAWADWRIAEIGGKR